MSIFIHNSTIDSMAEVGPAAFTIFAVLTMRRDPLTGECRPGIRTLAKAIRAGNRTVLDAIKRLEKAGWVKVTRRAGLPNSYTVVDVRIAEDAS